MALKTDYSDDVFDGNRKYSMITNGDGTVSLVDVTEYTREGDTFAAHDVNEITIAINSINSVRVIELPQSGWTLESGTIYTQTVAVDGVTEDMDLDLRPFPSYNETADEQKAYTKMLSILTSGTGKTNNGSVTFRIFKAATSTIRVGLKGVL